MAISEASTESSTAPVDDLETSDQGIQNSKEDAITPRQFELLVEATYTEMDRENGMECRLILFLAGRLGMRRAEIGHLTEDWVDLDRGVIVIPSHDPCSKGRGDSICGTCRQAVRQRTATSSAANYCDVHQGLGIKDELEPGGGEAVDAVVTEDALSERYWQPKTDAASREIPFGELTRAGLVTERFIDRFGRWPFSCTVINRRVDSVVEASDAEIDNLYPHALRASAANFWVRRGLDERPLKYLFGWEQMVTSASYIERSASRAIQAISEVAP